MPNTITNAGHPALTLTDAEQLREVIAERDQLRAERDQLREDRDRRIAQLRDLRAILGHRGTGWLPSTKVIYGALKAEAYLTPDDHDIPAILDGSAAEVQRLTGIRSADTCRDSLAQLREARVIGYTREKVKQRNPQTGEEYHTSTTTILIGRKPQELPELPRAAGRERHATRAALERAAFRALREVACPSCGTIGEFTVICRNCQHALEVAPDADPIAPGEVTPGAPDAPEGVKTGSSRFETADPEPDPVARGDISDAPSDPEGVKTGSSRRSSAYGGNFPGATGGSLTPGGSAPIAPSDPEGGDTGRDAPPVSDLDPARATTTGSATIEYLAGQLGAQFTLAQPKGKGAFKRDWAQLPETATTAIRHLDAGGNVGLLTGTGRADGIALCVIDLDANGEEFLRVHPELAAAPRIIRANAPDRLKIIVGVRGGDPGGSYKAPDRAARPIEYLARGRHAIVAGTHATGAPIECRPGALPIATGDHWGKLCRSWAGEPDRMPISTPPSRSPGSTPTGSPTPGAPTGEELHRIAIAWHCRDARVMAANDQLLSRCPQLGGKYAIRPDDHTPSASWSRDLDAYGKRILTDWGTGRRYDDLELCCYLTGTDKRRKIREVVAEYCRAHGLPIP